MSRPNNLRDDPAFWLCAFLMLLPPMWIVFLIYLIWNSPRIYREWREDRDCKLRGHHLWGEYQDHPFTDIPHRYCKHCRHGDHDSYYWRPAMSRKDSAQ